MRTSYNWFNQAIFKPVLNQNLDFQHQMVLSPFFVFSELRWDVIVPSTFYYRFNPAKCKPVLSQNIDFQRLMSFSSFCVQSVKVRGDCSLCWYWWNCWPSLFKLTFHNTNRTLIFFINVIIVVLTIMTLKKNLFFTNNLNLFCIIVVTDRRKICLIGSFSDNFYNSDGKDCNCVPLTLT